jgi:hypothetical protein
MPLDVNSSRALGRISTPSSYETRHPLYRLEHVVDHALIAIFHRANIDFGDFAVHPIETCASAEMILEWLVQSGSVGN